MDKQDETALARAVEQNPPEAYRGLRFSHDEMTQLRYAALLHDFGKVGVREKVLIKGKKLYVGEMLLIRQRFAYVLKSIEADHLRRQLELRDSGRATADALAVLDGEYERKRADVEKLLTPDQVKKLGDIIQQEMPMRGPRPSRGSTARTPRCARCSTRSRWTTSPRAWKR